MEWGAAHVPPRVLAGDVRYGPGGPAEAEPEARGIDTGPRLSGDRDLHRDGGSEAEKKFVYLKWTSNFRPINFTFFPEEKCFDVGLPFRPLPPPPHAPGNGKPWSD